MQPALVWPRIEDAPVVPAPSKRTWSSEERARMQAALDVVQARARVPDADVAVPTVPLPKPVSTAIPAPAAATSTMVERAWRDDERVGLLNALEALKASRIASQRPAQKPAQKLTQEPAPAPVSARVAQRAPEPELHSVPIATDQLAREFSIPPSPFVLQEPRAPIQAFVSEPPIPDVVELSPLPPSQEVEADQHVEPELESPQFDVEFDEPVVVAPSVLKVNSAQVTARDELTSFSAADSEVPSVEFELPAPPEPPAAPAPPAFKLDHARLARLQRDTAAVDQFLASIFVETDHTATPAPAPPSEPAATQPSPSIRLIADLDAEHTEVLLTLLARDAWSRSELQELAGRFDLMLDGALERINDVAFDLGGGALVEDGGDIYVDADVAAVLRDALSV
jgi:hypothetical protein